MDRGVVGDELLEDGDTVICPDSKIVKKKIGIQIIEEKAGEGNKEESRGIARVRTLQRRRYIVCIFVDLFLLRGV